MAVFALLLLSPLSGGRSSRADDAASPLARLELSEKMEALGGRVLLRLPDGARDEARQSSIMGAPESSDGESRFVITAGDDRMVVMVWELFALAPDDLLAGVKAELGGEAADSELSPFQTADPAIRAVRSRPKQPVVDNNAVLIDSAFLSLADGTVLSIGVYVNQPAFADLSGVQALATGIFGSIQGGTRVLDRQAGPRTLGELTMTVPIDVVVSRQAGPDFTVYLLRKLRRLGGAPPGTIGVYVGDHPAYIHSRREYSDLPVTKEKGRLLGREVEWDSWKTAEGMQTQEVIEPLDRSHPARQVHVFVTAQDRDIAEVLRRAAESLSPAAPRAI